MGEDIRKMCCVCGKWTHLASDCPYIQKSSETPSDLTLKIRECQRLQAELAAANAEVERGRLFREWVSQFYKEHRIEPGFNDWLARREMKAWDNAHHDDKPKGASDGE